MYSTSPPASSASSPGVAALAPPDALAAPQRRLLDQLRGQLRYLHYSLRTEEAYGHWVRAFVRWSGLRHPQQMGAAEVRSFLAWLATERRVSVSTHRQALAALLFLYQKVFGLQLPWMQEIDRPQRKPRLPVVLSVAEVRAVLALLDGAHAVLGRWLYGTGMRITEALQLRAKDVDFERAVIVVRCGKGGKDRVVMLPASLAPALKTQLRRAHGLWLGDARNGRGGVQMPDALARKYPRAGASWPWFGAFPQGTLSVDPRSGVERRTLSTTRPSSAPSGRRCWPPASPARPRRTRCAMLSPRTCCSRAPISARCRSCWATAT